ncbi:aminopeptidase N [Thiopseudomonas alkaliphila]|uniref:aminopeptidase N n=1 Tax=Thiopseudomonas alkaliphila TaxID=1697053 RepID=UPI0025786B90|nr:aminopeptidase N [Thiopseudomonas alkaliphila]MDM1708590.1 aminopeptidase N [Thiopseudomonas alkaliphila]
MRTEQPQMIRLSAYQQPDYLINETHLTFELYEEYALVHAQLVMQRNPALDTNLPPLHLDGQEISLQRLALNDRELGADEYQLSPYQLSLQPDSAAFVIDSTVRIEPQNNTALEGLYKSGGMFCTQCEAEGFRKITYYLDRPDVMSRFTTTLSADKNRYPVLLSNGNLIASGQAEEGRHWATWEDPFKKPAYLFALVAGDLWCVEDRFTTLSGREVTLQLYVEPKNIDKCQHGMDSLKKSMRWDEEKYGREYDLDIFMIVAVDDFNMGAMENKGLNIFNSSCVLAKPETATDATYQRIESIVAHEYFHNWSGNRVTCRDWFQLSLKEGFTVFRDMQFSADMNSKAVKRIEDVAYLRTHQFAEDAGPMAHPVRPEEYLEISNFYTLTIYEKGAEVVRMIHTLLGEKAFRQGSDLYFARHDGQAVTCDDFIAAMQEASGQDLTQFKRWYSQAGTPVLNVTDHYDPQQQVYRLTVKQSCPATPGQPDKAPLVIPLAVGLLDAKGRDLPLQLAGETQESIGTRVLVVTEAEQTFEFIKVTDAPVPSLLRDFSAPVNLIFAYSTEQLVFLLKHDSDGFNRWEAGQQLAVRAIKALMADAKADLSVFIHALGAVAQDPTLDVALKAEIFSLPSESYLIEQFTQADVQAIHQAREALRLQIAVQLKDALWTRYQSARHISQEVAYSAQADHVARRRWQNVALSYLMLTELPEIVLACVDQFEHADNMTERFAALTCLVNSSLCYEKQQALAAFEREFADDAQVMDQWFSVQAGSFLKGGLGRVKTLMQHPKFSIKNPNKVRSVIGAFANQSLVNFHQADGSGYAFLAEQILQLDRLNPQMAARILAPLTRWQRFAEPQRSAMKNQLQRIQQAEQLSPDVYEVVNKSL